jgi:hypothetical protein
MDLSLIGLGVYALLMHVSLSALFAQMLFSMQREGRIEMVGWSLQHYFTFNVCGGWILVWHCGAYAVLSTGLEALIERLRR